VELISEILENRQRQQVAAKIPFSGKIGDEDVDIIAAVLSLLRNAFIEAMEPVLDGTVEIGSTAG
jgi:hypothetical protein